MQSVKGTRETWARRLAVFTLTLALASGSVLCAFAGEKRVDLPPEKAAAGPKPPKAERDTKSPEGAMEEGLAALCRTHPCGFAHWDKETKRCIAIDFSSDSVYEP